MVMLLSDWYLDRREKRIQTAKAEGIAEGKAEVYREIVEWDRRRREAAARGEAFTEPPPGVPQNGSDSDSVSETVTREVAEARGPRRTGACCVSSTVGWVERMPSKP